MSKKTAIPPATARVRHTRMPSALRAFQAPAEICAELQRLGKPKAVESGTILFERGEENRGLFVITIGRFALFSGDDPVGVTRIAEKGCLLGLPATVRDAPYSLTAQAVTDAEVCVLSPTDLRALLATNPKVGMAVLSILADEVFEMRRIFKG